MKFKNIFLVFLLMILLPAIANAKTDAERLFGRILLNVERDGEAWYVNPVNKKRYFLGRPEDAFRVMRELGLGINEVDFQKIAQAGMAIDGDLVLTKKLAGRIILQVKKNGEAWYVNPVDYKKYYLGRPADAFRVMRELSLGVKNINLASIHKPGLNESLDQYSKYERKQIQTVDGIFKVDIIEIDLKNPNLKIITDTADEDNCKGNCQAKSLGGYVEKNKAFAAINGSYFCSLSGCNILNYYYYPIYNKNVGKMINEDQLKYWTTGPIMAFDENNKFYYFKDSREFGSVTGFETKNGVKLQAAIGNKPRLIEGFMNQLIEWEVDKGQLTQKASRNAIGYKDNKIYLVIAYSATVPNLANIMQSLGVEYALNLDGGYSSALYYNDEYMCGPGRDIPNAILFTTK